MLIGLLADKHRLDGFVNFLTQIIELCSYTTKEQLAMRPILSATKTYNYALAKWLDDKLKLLAANKYTITKSQRTT